MFRDQTVWITGASSGIGEAVAKEIAKEGGALVLSARRADELERVKAACLANGAAKVLALPLDVTDEAAIEMATAEAHAFTGRIDMLFNNAGISQRALAIDTTMATYRKLFEVDVFGQMALTKAVLPLMIKAGGGHIAVTASVAGKLGAPLRTGYCAAKHAVMGFFDALRAETADQNIRVTTVTPGFIRTNISNVALKGDGTEFGKMDNNIAGGMDVDAAARVIVRGFHKGTPEIAVGQGMEMNALWLKRLFPRLAFKMAAKMKARAS
ncbi:SDR family oxidoreductase [Gimibacter soli]|uniref:SDR family oxidoreductase n=1 Tax=Gimibacter soli TaxID=3024400 RepID=A0AAE9XRS4_9PROT|nr:SDR family oxidoreductase [Gimibacter soli]WCL53755.1 SDR family oxidoreductase [Gimibacter soli]